ncbi:molybdopterin-dependent oxidoreductase [Cohnella sp. CFH 77786]|uniref:xanthine dehydrogenase family protein molybdopterin-binding subunit n=1 Tax=Cohnella sp. CFH 77786 TaxID=2662265 RepID=UPI001C608EE2|nr:xanthine dehydrogenase family protein molybdopterin-binding subunit [Cohnella sp. CFH 77786]MBW5444939.1 molybdopterin-dependent oxidoreductase [Cohnella sp. CFH 77786]
MTEIGQSVPKKESNDKVTGAARYTADQSDSRLLYARLAVSPYAHARIADIDTSAAAGMPGVRSVLTGTLSSVLVGEEIRDRPIIARDRVRYYGEIVAVVVADTEVQAKRAADRVRVRYEPLPVVQTPAEALRRNAPILHERLGQYEKGAGVVSVPGTNIASVIRVRKGDAESALRACEVVAENAVSFAPSDHAAMETRCATAEILPDGRVVIESSTQAPFTVKRYLAKYFGLPSGQIVVRTPLVGGAYGGKTAVQLELIAYLASQAVQGRKVILVNTREEDMASSPVHIGLEASVTLGSDREGRIQAAYIRLHFDGGAYDDKSSDVARAAAADCSGPYGIEHVWCDCLTLYTNHPFAAAFRGYGHAELTFAVERAMDALADKLRMDPWELRLRNAAIPGDTAPTRDLLTPSNLGDLRTCLHRMRALSGWDGGTVRQVDAHRVRAMGISCFWKNSSIDPDASSGAIVTFNTDGSLNLETGVVEIGTGTKTVLAQMLAERMGMSTDRIHVKLLIDTQITPEHWKTVASRGTFMAGRAVLRAADDAIRQLLDIAACVLRAPTDELAIGGEKVYVRADPNVYLPVKDICYGYRFPNGNTIGGQIIGRGTYTQRRMSVMNPETGEGTPGPEWNVGAQAVEIEMDTRDCTYRIVKAVSVIDAGKVLNLKGALGQVMGAMSMGLSFASRETFLFNELGAILNPSLRDYPLIRYGENPEYVVEFVENPCLDAPFGARALGEHGLIGMPAALADALSRAAGTRLNRLPLFPETVWRARMGERP